MISEFGARNIIEDLTLVDGKGFMSLDQMVQFNLDIEEAKKEKKKSSSKNIQNDRPSIIITTKKTSILESDS